MHGKSNHFRIRRGSRSSHHLNAALGKFTLASRLGLLVPEQLGPVGQSLNARILAHPRRYHAGNRRRHVRAQHQDAALPVKKFESTFIGLA